MKANTLTLTSPPATTICLSYLHCHRKGLSALHSPQLHLSLAFSDSFSELKLTYSKPHILKVHNLVSFSIFIHP